MGGLDTVGIFLFIVSPSLNAKDHIIKYLGVVRLSLFESQQQQNILILLSPEKEKRRNFYSVCDASYK